MKINNVKIYLSENLEKENVIGFASLVYNDELFLNSICIKKNIKDGKIFLTFPTRTHSGQNKNFFYFNPIKEEVRKEIETVIMQKLQLITDALKNK